MRRLRWWAQKHLRLIFAAGRGTTLRERCPWFSVYLGPRHVSFPPGRKRGECSTMVGFSGRRPFAHGAWYAYAAKLPPRQTAS